MIKRLIDEPAQSWISSWGIYRKHTTIDLDLEFRGCMGLGGLAVIRGWSRSSKLFNSLEALDTE